MTAQITFYALRSKRTGKWWDALARREYGKWVATLSKGCLMESPDGWFPQRGDEIVPILFTATVPRRGVKRLTER